MHSSDIMTYFTPKKQYFAAGFDVLPGKYRRYQLELIFGAFLGPTLNMKKVEQRIGYIHQPYLVGGWATHLKNMLVKMGISPK